MSATVRQRARIARVRELQHNLAAVEATRAANEAAKLEHTASQLARLRDTLAPAVASGAAIAGLGELRTRLDTAQAGLAHPIAVARKSAEAAEDRRRDAHRDQEAATRLLTNARSTAEAAAERRASANCRPRRPGPTT